jgi:hypothetical protein
MGKMKELGMDAQRAAELLWVVGVEDRDGVLKQRGSAPRKTGEVGRLEDGTGIENERGDEKARRQVAAAGEASAVE